MAGFRNEDDSESIVAKRVREISLKELTVSTKGGQPQVHQRQKRRIEASDPYFSALDSSRDFIVWLRRHKDVRDDLSDDVTQVLLQLERLLHKIQAGALNDGYDYTANYNACYFDMAQVFELLAAFRAKLGAFMKNERSVMAATGMSTRDYSLFKAQVRRLTEVCDRLEKNVRLFMEELEKEFGIESVLPEEKVMIRHLSDGAED